MLSHHCPEVPRVSLRNFLWARRGIYPWQGGETRPGGEQEGAPAVIQRWNLEKLLDDAREVSLKEYQQWVGGPYVPTGLNHTPGYPDGDTPIFTLEKIRDDGYREYGYHPEAGERKAAHRETASREGVEIYQSA